MLDFDAALRIQPNNPSFWVSRGDEWRRDLRLDDAIADYDAAFFRSTPAMPRRTSPGQWSGSNGKPSTVRSWSFRNRSGVDPENVHGHMMLARLLATCYVDKIRNGAWAVNEANRACELAHWQDPDCLDTLAAACAEVGDFPAAIKWQTQAVKLVRRNVYSFLQQKAVSSGGRRGVGFEDRLAFYKSKKPTRE